MVSILALAPPTGSVTSFLLVLQLLVLTVLVVIAVLLLHLAQAGHLLPEVSGAIDFTAVDDVVTV